MSKARTLANLISDNAELADGQISVAEVVGAAPSANPTFTGNIGVAGNITNASGNFTLDVAGDIILDADDGQIFLKDNNAQWLELANGGSGPIIKSSVSDKDIQFQGVDNGSDITALTLDMSEAGAATFNSHIKTQTLLQSIGADTQTNVTSSQNIGIHLQNTSNTDGNFVPIDFYNSTGFVTGRIGAEFQDAGDRNTDLYFATRANGGALTERLRVLANGDIYLLDNGATSFHYDASVGLTINEAGDNRDFRVESDNNASMLFVDGGSDKIGINTGSPDAMLTVDTNIGSSSTGTLARFHASKGESDSTFFQIAATRHGTASVQRVQLQSFDDDGSTGRHLSLNPNGGSVGINTNSITEAPLNIQCNDGARAIRIVGRSDDYSEIDFFENDNTTQLVRHQAHATYYQIRTYAVPLKLATNGTDRVSIDTTGNTTFNVGSNHADFRVKSDNNSDMLFVDGGKDRVCIGHSSSGLFTQSARFEVDATSNSRTAGITTKSSALSLGLWRTTDGQIISFNNGVGGNNVGGVDATSSGVTYNTTSDRRLKDNIEPIADATDKLMSMKPVTHTWIADPEAPSVHGFIAQEMQEVVPEAVSGEDGGEEMMSMDYGRITPVLVAALQEATNEIKALKQRVSELEAI